MSEQLNNPEKIQPMFDDCDNCGKRYQLTPANSGARHYPKQEECDYLLCKCPHCNSVTRIFCQQESIQDARDNGLQVLDDEPYAEPEIYHGWLDVNGIELPKTYDLTPRHDELIQKFGETIIKMSDDAPDLFWDEMNSEQGKPYPQRWI